MKRSDAQWAWIDTTLVEQNGTLTPKVAKAPTEISTGGSGKPLARLALSSGQSFTLGWSGNLPQPTVKGSTAVYPNAAGPQADLAVTALATGFRYEIILRTRPSKVTDFTFPLLSEGLQLTPTKRGTLEGMDSKGRLTAIAGNPFMKGVKPKEPSRRIASEVVDSGNGQALIVKPDAGYLADPSTSYPVTISSTVSLPLTKEADVADDGQLADPNRAFMTAGSIFGIYDRIYLRFNAHAVVGQDIVDAKLSLLNTDSPGCGDVVGDGIQVREVTGAWDQNNLTWDNKPATSATHAQTNTEAYSSDCDPTALEWSVTPIVQNWAAGSPNWGFALQSPDETSTDDNWRVFTSSEHEAADYPPKLTITAQSAPVPTVLYPAGPDGVEVFTVSARWRGDSIQLGETSSAALDMAQIRTNEHSDLLARPYVERATGDLVAPATAAGRDTAGQLLSGVAGTRGVVDPTLAGPGFEDEDAPTAKAAIVPPATTDFSVTPRVVEVANSAQQLNDIIETALEPNSGLPGDDAIFAGNIWDERNLAIVQSTSASPELRRALADRYGVNNIAIWLRTEDDRVSTTGQRQTSAAPSSAAATDTRQKDIGKLNGNSHFSSGFSDGKTYACTTAFAWGTETDNLFMTAGHCVEPNSLSFGDVVWTNWRAGVGTIGLPGHTTTYGDLALMKVGHPPANPRTGSAAMFFGPANTSVKHWVIGRDPVRSQVGDQYCVGGATTGDSCSWRVAHLGWKIKYYDKDGNYKGRVRWVDEGQSIHACKKAGDSGGAVYNFGTGGIIAKGITSGANAVEYTPSADRPCVHDFTDIADAVRASGYEIRKH